MIIMEQIKLLLLIPGKKTKTTAAREWILEKTQVYSIGRSTKAEKADLDFSFDKSLSCRELLVFVQAGRWCIRDTGKRGVCLNCTKVGPGQAVPVKEYDRITIGKRLQLVVVSPCREIVFWKNICFVIGLTGSLNYALLYSGLPLIQAITLYNAAETSSRPFTLQLAIEPFYRKEFRIPALNAAAGYDLAHFGIYPELFPDQTTRLIFSMETEKTVLFQKALRGMSFNTWLKTPDPFACTSLASFVLPNHTYVLRISEKVRSFLKAQDPGTTVKPALLGAALYAYLEQHWHIAFKEEQPGAEYCTQAIRLPHHILYDWDNKTGEANCLDLSLLLASCLENLQANPVLVILEIGKSLWHCLAGARESCTFHTKPLTRAKTEIPCDLLLFDPNGITSNIPFSTAMEQGRQLFENHPLLFALDIKAAREYAIRPLPFEAQPRESPAVIQAVIKAKELALAMHAEYKVCTATHLLIALLQARNNFVCNLFRTLGVNIEKAVQQLTNGLRNINADKKVVQLAFSRNFQLLLPRATAIAKENKSLFIMEEHLFLALLELQGSSLDKAFHDLGINKETLRLQVCAFLREEPSVPAEIKSFYNNKEKKLFFF